MKPEYQCKFSPLLLSRGMQLFPFHTTANSCLEIREDSVVIQDRGRGRRRGRGRAITTTISSSRGREGRDTMANAAVASFASSVQILVELLAVATTISVESSTTFTAITTTTTITTSSGGRKGTAADNFFGSERASLRPASLKTSHKERYHERKNGAFRQCHSF
jgi:hypothetical protein